MEKILEEAAKPARPKKLDALTGIRAIAAIWVVLYHVETHTILKDLNFGFLTPLLMQGYLGVDLFFILSGFIISYVHQKDFVQLKWESIRQFAVLRFARIYPVHLFMLIVFGLFYVANIYWFHQQPQPPKRYTLELYALNLLNMQSWFTSQDSWNYPSWSVSAEWLAYLTFPFLTPLMGRIKKLGWNFILIAVVLTVFYAVYQNYGKVLGYWTYQIGLLRVMLEFIIGCSLFNLIKHLPASDCANNTKPTFPWDISALVLGTGIIAACYYPVHEVLIVALIGIFLFCLTQVSGLMNQLLGNRVMVYLGEISYSTYMVHLIYIIVARQVLAKLPQQVYSEPFNILFILAMVLGLYGCSALIFQFVEKPFRIVVRDFLLPKRRQQKSGVNQPIPQP